MNTPSQLDNIQDITRRLVAEQLKRNAINYNIKRFSDFKTDIENLSYEYTGLDEVEDRIFTKKERLYRTECFDTLKQVYKDLGDPGETMDKYVRKISDTIGDINLDKFDTENEKLTKQIKSNFSTLELIDILDVGADK